MSTKKKTQEDATLDTGQRKPLENLEDVALDIQAKKEESEAKKPGKKRGPYNKKKKEEPEQPPVENPFDTIIIGNVYNLLFATIAEKNGQDHWKLQPAETDALAQATNAVIEKWLPRLGPWMVELNLALTITGIFGMRLYMSAQIKKAEDAKRVEDVPKAEPDAPIK